MNAPGPTRSDTASVPSRARRATPSCSRYAVGPTVGCCHDLLSISPGPARNSDAREAEAVFLERRRVGQLPKIDLVDRRLRAKYRNADIDSVIEPSASFEIPSVELLSYLIWLIINPSARDRPPGIRILLQVGPKLLSKSISRSVRLATRLGNRLPASSLTIGIKACKRVSAW